MIPKIGIAVHEDAGDAAAQDGLRHVLLRVDHLLGRPVRELEADVVEEHHRHEGEKHGAGGSEVAPVSP